MPKKLLLADDSITIQKVVELTFSDGDYEVIAVNNGAKAIQKLSEVRPDIILSDIIMPEKNGYEVCEFVKSHPEFRTIPVVLLTGTFEPFDPDRADKAGCDAVVTKPFESQSLIQKVEELIESSQASSAPAPAAPPPQEEATPWSDAAASSPAPDFGAGAASIGGGDPFGAATHDNDIFNAPPAEPQSAASDMPFETAEPEAFSGETRAFTKMSFEDMQRMASEPAAAPQPPATPAEPEAAPWEEPPAFSGETRAFTKMNFDDLQQAAPGASAPEAASPWSDEPAAAQPPAAPTFDFGAPPAAASSPFEESAGLGDETRQMSREALGDFNTPPESSAPAAGADASPWEEQSGFGGETRALPRMSFEELQRMESTSAPSQESQPEPEPVRSDSSLFETPATPSAASWPEPSTAAAASADEGDGRARTAAEAPFGISTDESPFDREAAAAAAAAPAEAEEPRTAPAAQPAAMSGDLTDEQIERIARRVVQMLSTDVLRSIAWEVIPDTAEMIVKERIRQLESEA